jgi:D-tyrosyl-tRNA(Tyr) deacylase
LAGQLWLGAWLAVAPLEADADPEGLGLAALTVATPPAIASPIASVNVAAKVHSSIALRLVHGTGSVRARWAGPAGGRQCRWPFLAIGLPGGSSLAMRVDRLGRWVRRGADVRLVVQRAQRAVVRIGDEVVGQIGRGAVVLVGIGSGDSAELVDRMADKLIGLRYFEDARGQTNLDLAEAGGELLVVSQFTLYADLRRGRRPGFTRAAAPDVAQPLVERFAARLRVRGARVETGQFGAEMAVELVNDGPFTLVLDSDRDLAVPG